MFVFKMFGCKPSLSMYSFVMRWGFGYIFSLVLPIQGVPDLFDECNNSFFFLTTVISLIIFFGSQNLKFNIRFLVLQKNLIIHFSNLICNSLNIIFWNSLSFIVLVNFDPLIFYNFFVLVKI